MPVLSTQDDHKFEQGCPATRFDGYGNITPSDLLTQPNNQAAMQMFRDC